VNVARRAMSNAAGRIERGAATSTAAMPTSEWNAATSSGIEVIGTRRAITRRRRRQIPSRRSPRSRQKKLAGGCSASVVTIAIAMPAMPKKLPCRLEAGLESPRSERMNRTPATR